MNDQLGAGSARDVGSPPVGQSSGGQAADVAAINGVEPEARRRDALAWGVAATPLLVPIAGYFSACAGEIPPRHWIYLLPATVSYRLIVLDKGRIEAARRASKPLPSAAWALLPVVYLWRRASALSLPQHQAWTWICLNVASSFLFFAAVTLGAYQTFGPAAAEVPGCADPKIAATLEDIFNSMPIVKEGETTAVSVSRQAEVVSERPVEGRRSCTATILDRDDEDVHAAYQIELRGSEVVVHLQLLDVVGTLASRGRAG